MKKSILIPLMLFAGLGFSLNAQEKQNPNISKELGAILKSHEGGWRPHNGGEDPYFISIKIVNGYILWSTSAENDGMKMINDCHHDSVISAYSSKDLVLKDTMIIAEDLKTKTYRKTIFPAEEAKCITKTNLLSFTSHCFWEEKVKVEMVFYCTNKLLLVIKDSKEKHEFWFTK